jgi:replicative DNA helicase
MNLLTEWADKENKAILVVHHNNKSTTGGIRGASAFVDAVRLQYELLTNNNNDNKKENAELLPAGYRQIVIQKDNWGVERILGKKELEIQIFRDEIESKRNNNGKKI